MSEHPRLDRWQNHTEWPLAAAALVFLATYSIDVLAQPHGALATVITWVYWSTWAGFTVDYVVRLGLAPDRKRWFIRHLLDLGIILLPFLRPLRLLRFVVLVTAMQKAVGNAIRGRVIVYTISGAVLLVYVSSLAVLEAERGQPHSDISNFGDAVWWSITTITTVGYGDLAPVSVSGRLIAVLLMIGGISLVGAITATLASWIVQRVAEDDDGGHAATVAQVEELRADVRRLTESLQRKEIVDDVGDVAGSEVLSGEHPAVQQRPE